MSIGIPTDDDPEDRPVVPGWQVPLASFFNQRNRHAPPAMYAYDFDDDWQPMQRGSGYSLSFVESVPANTSSSGRSASLEIHRMR